MKVSAIIPSRNRPYSLQLTLRSLLRQTRLPDEVIVVDASENKTEISSLKDEFSIKSIIWIDAYPSVCAQRNLGISMATGDWIFFCDDDIELEVDYLETLEKYLEAHPMCGVVAGRLLQLESNSWVDQYPVKSFHELLWRFVFQLSIWGEIDRFKTKGWMTCVLRFIRKFYGRHPNDLSLAGWPVITQWRSPVFHTKTYSLGANMIRKDWLSHSKYDEVLDPYGIGDNYGLALDLGERGPIHVINATHAFHHRAGENRLDPVLAYYRRVLALQYFTRRKQYGWVYTTVFLLWSLTGNSLMSMFKRDFRMMKANAKAMLLIAVGRNPYWLGFLKRRKGIEPFF